MIDINTLWNDTKIKLSARLQAISYEVWIEKLEPICFIGHTLVLQTGSQSSKNTIVKNYRETILEAVKEVNPIISANNHKYETKKKFSESWIQKDHQQKTERQFHKQIVSAYLQNQILE